MKEEGDIITFRNLKEFQDSETQTLRKNAKVLETGATKCWENCKLGSTAAKEGTAYARVKKRC